jgi:hypothetical protein
VPIFPSFTPDLENLDEEGIRFDGRLTPPAGGEATMGKRPTRREQVMDWLLEEEQPAIRYLALTQLLDRPQTDPEVQSASKAIPVRGWAADILARQESGGWWGCGENLYRPKYLSSNWMLLILADLGLTRRELRIRKACELWLERFAKKDGGFAMDGSSKSHLCTTGNTARALVQFGYGDHPQVESAFEWLAAGSLAGGAVLSRARAVPARRAL